MSTSMGERGRTGDWWPADPIEMPAPFVWPPRPLAVLRWFFGYPGYLWPLNSLYLGITLVTWFFLTPDLDAMRSFEAGWIATIFVRNLALALAVYGGLHLYLYVLAAQGTGFKYSSRPQARNSRAFLFGNQVWDNMFWSLAAGVPVWTTYEVVTLWAFANRLLPLGEWGTNPVWFGALLLAIPFIHGVHFYLVHRLLHWRPLYAAAHYLHHRNVNPGPWSGLSMHPLELLLYFSGALILWLIAPHPIHALFHLQLVALAPALGHCGFERVMLGGERALMANTGFHYLHHKHFECNYSGELLPIFDKWFGTFHDGSEQAHARLREHLAGRRY